MGYLKELVVLAYSLAAFGAILYVWHNYLSPWRDPNKKLMENANKWASSMGLVKCNNCGWFGKEDDLSIFNEAETHRVGEFTYTTTVTKEMCPKCLSIHIK